MSDSAKSSERITHEIVTTWSDGDCKMIKTSSEISVVYPPTGTADYASDHFGVYAYDDHTDIIPMTEDGHVFGACVTRVPEVSHERAIEEFMDNNQDRHVRIVGYDEEPEIRTDGGEDLANGDLQPRERCPRCSSLLEHESRDPLEEFCIEPGCDYYRAAGVNGTVIRE